MDLRGNRLNFLVGVVITGLISALAIWLLLGEYQKPVFAPHNTWLWISLLCVIPFGFALSFIGMLRRIGCGYFIWSQLLLALLVSMTYFGWYRIELDYANMRSHFDAMDRSPPSANLSGLMILLLAWLLFGFLPLAVRQLIRWNRARKMPASGEAPSPSTNAG